MDSSIRLSVLLGDLRVPAPEITPEEWVHVLEVVLRRMNPWWKYCRVFLPVGQLINRNEPGIGDLSTAPEALRFPPDVTRETQCHRLYRSPGKTEQREAKPPNRHEGMYEVEEILVTRDGILLRWYARYDTVARDITLLHGGTHYQCTGRATLSVFSVIGPDHILGIARQHPAIVARMLSSVVGIAEDLVVHRERYLETARDLYRGLASIEDRISDTLKLNRPPDPRREP